MLNKPAHTKLLPPPHAVDDLSIYYPESDGEPLAESDRQFYPLTETVHALRLHFAHRPDVYVAGDMLVYYRMNDNLTSVAPDVNVGPDVFIVFGVDDHLRRSYIVWREGKAPDFVMEIASLRACDNDIGHKRDLYTQLGVGEYWRCDPTGECFNPPLAGEMLVAKRYRPIPIAEDSGGILRGHSATLELDICVRPHGELRWYDPVAGEWLRNLDEAEATRRAAQDALLVAETEPPAAQDARLTAEDARLTSETERRAALDRIRQLEAALLKQRGAALNDD